MKKAACQLFLDGQLIPPDRVKQIAIKTTIDEMLPIAVISISDKSGETLSTFRGLAIGQELQVSLVDIAPEEEDSQEFITTTFCVASVTEKPQELVYVAGVVEILAVHPWLFYRDYSSHAYKGLPNSDIIKQLLKNSERVWQFDMSDTKTFVSSDEDGSIPRYKTAEDDLSFIKNKLLPYTTINHQPPLFWVDELNKPHLSSFRQMFAESPKSLLTYASPSSAGENASELDSLASECGNKVYLYNTMTIKIGDENVDAFIPAVKPGMTIDCNSSTGVALTAHYSPQVSISDKDKKLPVFGKVVAQSKTSLNVLKNGNSKDLSSLCAYSMKDFYRMFRVAVRGPFIGEQLRPGDCVYLYSKIASSSEETAKTHWLSGKWLIVGERILVDKNGEVLSEVILSRPTFISSDKLSIEFSELLADATKAKESK